MGKSKGVAMSGADKSSEPVFEPIQVAARRLGRNVGHLRKVCLGKWAKLGLARLEKHDAKGTWYVRSDATVPPRRKPGKPTLRGLPGEKTAEELLRLALKKYPIPPGPVLNTDALGCTSPTSAPSAPTIVIHVAAGATLIVNPANASK